MNTYLHENGRAVSAGLAPAADLVGSHFRDAAKADSVVDFDSFFSLPPRPQLARLPGGFYYPIRERHSDTFGLKKLHPTAAPSPSLVDAEFDFGMSANDRQAMLDRRSKSEFGESEYAAAEAATRTQRERYFPLEDYHAGLRSAKENVSKFVENEAFYRGRNLNFKRSVLLFGEPGTGKSRLLYEICMGLVASHEAVVIKIDGDDDLDCFYDHGLIPVSQQLRPRFKVLLIEELSQLCRSSRDLVKLLHLLDSFILNDNVLFLMSTNYPERIPSNVIDRPSRVDFIARVDADGFDAGMPEKWYEHLVGRPLDAKAADGAWMNAKLTPAYLKELYTHAEINACSLKESWDVIRKRRALVTNHFAEAERRVGFTMGEEATTPSPPLSPDEEELIKELDKLIRS